MRPVPTDKGTSFAGATAPAGWAAAWPVIAAAMVAASAAAIAVPSVARLSLLLLIILSGSHRNERDIVAASDAHDRALPLGRDAGRGWTGRAFSAVVAAPL